MNTEGMDKYDWDGIALLLDVVEKSAGHPKLKNITSAALALLDQIANPPPEEVEEVDEAPAPSPPPESKAASNNDRRV